MQTDKELKPCPFCGGSDLETNANSVSCNNCGGAMILEWVASMVGEEAAASWNTRPDRLANRLEALSSGEAVAWQPIETAPKDGTRVVVWFKSGGPVVAFKDTQDATTWVRHLGFGKSAYWPEIHDDYAQAWLALPPPPHDAGGRENG